MPELPEVEVVRSGLAKQICDQAITQVRVYHPRSLRNTTAEELQVAVLGKNISSVVRRGKFLWWILNEKNNENQLCEKYSFPNPKDSQGVLVHLGMSGQMLVHSPSASMTDEKTLKHLRVQFCLADGRRVSFVDQRTFGRLHPVQLLPTTDGKPGGWGSSSCLIPEGLAETVARDVLDPAVNWKSVIKNIQKRKIPIKNLLLDQKIVSGIGNIYADEALFKAQVNPMIPGYRLTAQTIERVYRAADEVMRQALKEGGTSFDSLYVDPNGNPGYFARSLQCYGRGGLSCLRCETKLKQIKISNRSAVFCPNCQNPPGSRWV